MDKDKLRGAIYSRYRSASACADAIGWSRQRFNNILSGRKIPNVNEIKKIAEACCMTNEEMLSIFLPSQSQN